MTCCRGRGEGTYLKICICRKGVEVVGGWLRMSLASSEGGDISPWRLLDEGLII